MIDYSHGLRYELAAAIARLAVLNNLARLHPAAHVIPLRVGGLGLLPITDEAANGLDPAPLCHPPHRQAQSTDQSDSTINPEAQLLTGPESGFSVLTPKLQTLFEIGSHRGPIVYLEADYLGREGCQSAVLWRHGHVSVGPLLLGRQEIFSTATAPISVALRALGITAVGRRDEFVVAGLGRCRSTQEWAERQDDQP
ncbi:MAG TPA: hypothetical protein VH084_11145 [Mycobacterium sp.]|jgi:hypothetical protein|nr:hypothetical protein [Mycobacterium sp.]